MTASSRAVSSWKCISLANNNSYSAALMIPDDDGYHDDYDGDDDDGDNDDGDNDDGDCNDEFDNISYDNDRDDDGAST